MAFPRALRLVNAAAATSEAIEQGTTSTGGPPLVREVGALLSAIAADYGGRVSESTALKVPAVTKALKTYTHTIAAFPMREYVDGVQTVPRPLLSRPSKVTTYGAFIARLIKDLLLYDTAYCRITERAWDGYPSALEHMPFTQVLVSPTMPGVQEFPIGAVSWNGVPIPGREVVRFDGDGTGGWLAVGSSTIVTAAALEAAALRYAEYPLPTIIIKNTGADLPADQVDGLLSAWESARTNRSTAYLNSALETKELGWNAADLQLVDARNAAAIQIARLANLDPIWTGAGVPGSSLTYSNRVDLYRQLLDTALTPVMNMVAQRLSLDDFTPRGHTVRFDTSVFLKANPLDLANLITQMLPLGVLSIDEARALLDLPSLGVNP